MSIPISKRRSQVEIAEFPFMIWKLAEKSGKPLLIGMEATKEEAQLKARELSRFFPNVGFGFLDRTYSVVTKSFQLWW